MRSNAGMTKQTKGHRLALLRPPSVGSLVGWLIGSHQNSALLMLYYLPMIWNFITYVFTFLLQVLYLFFVLLINYHVGDVLFLCANSVKDIDITCYREICFHQVVLCSWTAWPCSRRHYAPLKHQELFIIWHKITP